MPTDTDRRLAAEWTLKEREKEPWKPKVRMKMTSSVALGKALTLALMPLAISFSPHIDVKQIHIASKNVMT